MADRLLDTNIVSYLFKNHPLAQRYVQHIRGHILHVCFMTVAESFEGAFRAGWGAVQLARLESYLNQFLIIPADPDICRRWAEIRAMRRTQPIGVADAWIAAAALNHGLDLLTHNPKDFAGVIGSTVISESP